MKELFEDFIKMQAELPSVMKSATGQAGNQRFKYADLSEIITTIRPTLFKYGFGFTQRIEENDEGVSLRTTIMHKSGHYLESNTPIDYKGEDIKKFGAAITYYRRYTLQTILGIVADDDADDKPETITKNITSKEIDMTRVFCAKHQDSYTSQQISAFLNAKSNYEKRSVLTIIEGYMAQPDTFSEHIDMWLAKHGKS